MARSAFIFSCKPESADLCLNEFRKSGLDLRFHRWLDPGTGIVSSKNDREEVAGALQAKPPVFLLHIFPWEYSVIWGGLATEAPHLDGTGVHRGELPDILAEIAERMNDQLSFSVQMGRVHRQELRDDPRKDIRDYLLSKGFSQNMRQPDQVVSVYHSEGLLYIGLSAAKDNISSWFGGKVAYAVREDTVSRSEFKLLEAIDHFGLHLPATGPVVDFGAAPGGWSKVMLDRGLEVIAVDPGDMAETIRRHPQLQHYRGTAQQFIRSYKGEISLLLNDMRLDVEESVQICLDTAPLVKPGALLIMSFKLPGNQKTSVITAGRKALSTAYEILYVKELFHNRSEVTVIGKRIDN